MSTVGDSLREARELLAVLNQVEMQIDALDTEQGQKVESLRDDVQDLTFALTTLVRAMGRMGLPENVQAAVRGLQTMIAAARGAMMIFSAMELVASGGVSPFAWLRFGASMTAGLVTMTSSVYNGMTWEIERRQRE
jgi:hypothetical protein